jgi:hypothetical protein
MAGEPHRVLRFTLPESAFDDIPSELIGALEQTRWRREGTGPEHPLGMGGRFRSDPLAARDVTALREAVRRLHGGELDVTADYLVGRTYADVRDDVPTTVTLGNEGDDRIVAIAREDLQRQFKRYGTAFVAAASQGAPSPPSINPDPPRHLPDPLSVR